MRIKGNEINGYLVEEQVDGEWVALTGKRFATYDEADTFFTSQQAVADTAPDAADYWLDQRHEAASISLCDAGHCSCGCGSHSECFIYPPEPEPAYAGLGNIPDRDRKGHLMWLRPNGERY